MDSRDRDALVADRIRHLVADTAEKLDRELDRQYLVEDLCSRLLTVATHLDGRYTGPGLEDMVSARHAFQLTPRTNFHDDLAGSAVDPGTPFLDADEPWRP